MKTQINKKVKLSLNKRTIVLLNEQDMRVMDGGTGFTGNERDLPVSKNPADCTGGTTKKSKRFDNEGNCVKE
jgi:hypothetical protein